MRKKHIYEEDIKILKEFYEKLEKAVGINHEQTILYRLVIELAELTLFNNPWGDK